MNEQLQMVKDEKTLQQNCNKLLSSSQFGIQEVKGNMMDVRTADGNVVKISTNIQEQELAKTLGVEMVQNMYAKQFQKLIKSTHRFSFRNQVQSERRRHQPTAGLSRGLRQTARRHNRSQFGAEQWQPATDGQQYSNRSTENDHRKRTGTVDEHYVDRQSAFAHLRQPFVRSLRQNVPIPISSM